MSDSIKHIIALVLVLLVLGGGYFVATNDNFFTQHGNRSDQIEKDTKKLEEEIIVPLNRISSVEIDDTFFTSPEFLALDDDMSIELLEPALFRVNPFASVSANANAN